MKAVGRQLDEGEKGQSDRLRLVAAGLEWRGQIDEWQTRIR